jgi:hypothetical protein
MSGQKPLLKPTKGAGLAGSYMTFVKEITVFLSYPPNKASPTVLLDKPKTAVAECVFFAPWKIPRK